MLRIIQNSTAGGAKSYYTTADYYAEGEQELVGVWRGEGAKRLGLEGGVTKEVWDKLCDNKDPDTGKTLTARQKANRRIGYDVNFHAPKGVSVYYGLTADGRVLDAFREAVDETMQDMEAEIQTRVRKGGLNEDRTTGNMVAGEFIHFTARPVDGVPDPHLHAHVFVHNITWDSNESRWKAIELSAVKRDAPYFEALFHSRLAYKLEGLGLATERTRKGWDLAGIPKSIIRTFSRRTALIEAMAQEKGITDPDHKAELGAKTRGRKRKDLTMAELREEWRSRLSSEDEGAVDRLGTERQARDLGRQRETGQHAVELAIQHCTERSAVVPERRLLAEALKRSYGASGSVEIKALLASQPLLSATRDGERLVTTTGVLEEERAMLAFARNGRGAAKALAMTPHEFARDWLNSGQRRAVEHVLASRDKVMLIRGSAGTGKTSLMQEAVAGIEAGGHRVFLFAPSADASRGVLRQEGFAEADTVARLLLDERLQQRARGQVLWVDEAALLGTRTMAHLFNVANRIGARVVLSGDPRQHGSVERGAVLRLLEEDAGVVAAEVKDIQRQKGGYKQAVQLLSEGRTVEGFRELCRLGWVKEVSSAERTKMLARDYVSTVESGKSALVVSPTHREGDEITHEIRGELRAHGKLHGKERRILLLESENLTEAERRDPVNYSANDVILFHQNAKGYTKGERVAAVAGNLPLDQAGRFQVYRSGQLSAAPGEILRITRNGTTLNKKHRLNNGQLVTLKGFDKAGNLVLTNGWTVAKDYGHLTYGYCQTSHSSQGKTVDKVIVGQSSASLLASSREQFYVSISRAREQATVYTDDKELLLESIGRSDERLSATELLSGKARHIVRTGQRGDGQREEYERQQRAESQRVR